MHEEPPLDSHGNPAVVFVEGPSLARGVPARRNPVDQDERRALGELERLRLPVARTGETDNRIGGDDEQAVRGDARVEVGARPARRSVNLRGGLRREKGSGAAEFFSSPRALRNLRGILAKEGIRGFPAAYQVVVKCTFSNMLLLAYEYDSHKILVKE